MATDTLERFGEQKLKLIGPETTKRPSELLAKILSDALELAALAGKTSFIVSKRNRLKELLEDIRVASEEMREAIETQIAAVLTLADSAVRVWEEMWRAALAGPAGDRAKEMKILRWVLNDAEQTLRDRLAWAQEHADLTGRQLARLDELKAKAAEFPVWARECLARWDMLDRPAPPLDAERIARAKVAYARGEYEDVDHLLSRVAEGGPWVKE